MKNKAFTLVELAIVIVIIGLLVGGVLSGQELIKQARYRTLMKDVEGYKSAVLTFKAKYNCLAGDCPKAYSFFADQSCGTNSIISGTANLTGCNGDGNGVISFAEGQLMWFHLASAKIIKGSYTAGYKSQITAGVDVPLIAVKDSVGISMAFANGSPSSSTSCGYTYCHGASDDGNIFGYFNNKNVFIVGNVRTSEYLANGSFFTPTDAFEFDTKFDDGKVFGGAITGYKGRKPDASPGQCATIQVTNLANAGYCLNGSTCSSHRDSENCIIVFDSGI